MYSTCGHGCFTQRDSLREDTRTTVCGARLAAHSSRCVIPKMGFKMPGMGISADRNASRSARRKAAAKRGDRRTSLADALFTTTQQRVLSLLFGQPSRSFFASELIELTGSGSGAVQRELQRLVSSGLGYGDSRRQTETTIRPILIPRCSKSCVVWSSRRLRWPNRSAKPLSRSTKGSHWLWCTARSQRAPITAASDIDLLVVSDQVMLEDIYSALAPVENEFGPQVRPDLVYDKGIRRKESLRKRFPSPVCSRTSTWS